MALAKEISKQPSIDGVAWLLVATLSMAIMKKSKMSKGRHKV